MPREETIQILFIASAIPEQQVLVQNLVEQGFEVSQLAVDRWETYGNLNASPELILFDAQDGSEERLRILTEIRKMVGQHSPPILVLCTRDSNELRLKCWQHGGTGFILKTSTFSDLLMLIRSNLQKQNVDGLLGRLDRSVRALQKGGQALLGMHELNALLRIILDQLREVVAYDSASIMLVEGTRLQIVAHVGFVSETQIFSYQQLQALKHVQEVLESHQSQIIPDTFQDTRWHHREDSDYIHCWMGIPLVVDGEAIGLLNIDKREKYYYGNQDAELASAFALQAAMAIRNAQTLDRLARQSQLTRALVQVSRRLAETLDIDRQMESIWEFVSLQFQAPMFLIGFLDSEENSLHLRTLYDMAERKPAVVLNLSEQGRISPAVYVAVHGKPIQWFNEAEKRSAMQELKLVARKTGHSSLSFVMWPLVVNEQTLGVISIQSDRPHAWSEIELDAFQTLTSLVAVSLKNAQLYHDIQVDKKHLYTAYMASREIISATEPSETMRSIVEHVCTVVNAWRACAILIDEQGHPSHLTNVGFMDHMKLATSIRQTGISLQVQSSGAPIFLSNIQHAKDVVHPAMLAQGVQAAACLPLQDGSHSIGVLWIHFKEPHSFTPVEKDVLALFASEATIAHENARHLQELEHLQQLAQDLTMATSLEQIILLIVHSARLAFQADSSAIWSYDDERDLFLLDGSTAEGIPDELWNRFRFEEPRPGQTAFTVMEKSWIGVRDIHKRDEYPYLGQPTRDLLSKIDVCSFQGVSLRVGEEKMGVLYLNYNTPRGFSDSDRQAATAFANLAALALKRARLMMQSKRVNNTAELVARVTTLGDLKGSLQMIVEGMRDVVDCDTVTLYTYDQDHGTFDFPPAMVGVWYPEKVTELDQVDKDSVPYRIIALGKLHACDNVDSDPIVRGNFTAREKIRSFIGVPLIYKNRKVGVMCLSYRHFRRFTSDDLAYIRLLGFQAALAIQHSVFYGQLEEKARVLLELQKAGRLVTQSLRLEDIYRATVREAYQLTGIHGKEARFSTLALKENNELTFQAAYPDLYLVNLNQNIGRIRLDGTQKIGISGRAAVDEESVLCGNTREHPDYISFDLETHSELAVPIRVGDEVIGVINAEHPDVNTFTAEDQSAFEVLASYTAIAIQNARSFNELRTKRLQVNSMLSLMRVTTEASTSMHMISNYFATIADITKLIAQDLDDDPGHTKVIRHLEQINQIIAEIQNIPMPPLSAEEGVESIDINQLIGERGRQYTRKKGRFEALVIRQEFLLEPTTTVRASREWLRRLLDIVINNSVDAMQGCDEKVLCLRTEPANPGVLISVIDTGRGISENLLPQLFEGKVEKKKGDRGLGLGLVLAKWIVQTYGGHIKVGATGLAGTTIHIWFPVEF